MPKYLKVILLLTALVISACNRPPENVLVFENEDKSFAIGLYMDTAFMTIDDNRVQRVGIRGFERLNGETSEELLGFECRERGGSYTTLFDSRREFETVTFDSGTWQLGGHKMIDRAAEEACRHGAADYGRFYRPGWNVDTTH